MNNFKIVKVPLDNDKEFYKKYVEYVIMPYFRIPYQAGMIFAMLMYYYNGYIENGYEEEEASRLTFDYSTYDKIKDELHINSSQIIYNNMSNVLKKNNLIIGKRGSIKKQINPSILIKKKEHINGIILNFTYAK